MTTDLAALSAAATQGKWQVAAWYQNSGTPDELCGGFIEADDSPTGVIDENWMQDSESLSRDLDFIVALVNAYRTGNLVQIDREGMRERVAHVIAEQLGDDYDMVPKTKNEWVKARGMCGGFPRDINAPFRSDYDAAADAAIAAILGGEHDRAV